MDGNEHPTNTPAALSPEQQKMVLETRRVMKEYVDDREKLRREERAKIPLDSTTPDTSDAACASSQGNLFGEEAQPMDENLVNGPHSSLPCADGNVWKSESERRAAAAAIRRELLPYVLAAGMAKDDPSLNQMLHQKMEEARQRHIPGYQSLADSTASSTKPPASPIEP